MKENETRGRSNFNPVNYKGDVLTQVWIDSRILATLSNWLKQNDTYPRFMSEVVRRPLEVLVEHLVSEGRVEMIDDTTMARSMLNREYGIKLNRGEKGKKNTQHNMILSDRRNDLDEMLKKKEVRHLDMRMTKNNSERVQEIHERAMRALTTINEKDVQKQTKQFIDINNCTRDKNRCYTEPEPEPEPELELDSKEINKMTEGEFIVYRQKRDDKVKENENKPIKVEDFDVVEG